MADVGAVTEPPPAKQPTQRVCSGGGMGEVAKVQAEPVTKELLDEDGVPIMQYALAVPQGFGGDDGVTAWLGPERAPPLPLPELIPGDEADDPAFAAWLRAAPLAPRWVKSERDFLDLVRSECREELARAPPYLAYRRENGLDEILAFLRKGDVPQSGWPLGDFFKDRLAVCPCSTSLFDVKGNALCVEQYGFWPAHRLRDWEANRGRGRRSLREGWGEIARLCTIFDMKGLTFGHALLPGGYRMVKQLIPLVQRYYPWLQDTTHFVNASMAVSTFFAYLRPLLPKHTQRKIYIHGLGATGALTEEIRPDFLPEALGGRAVCLDLAPPPTCEEYDARVAAGDAGLATATAAEASHDDARPVASAVAPEKPPPAAEEEETARREPGTMVPGIEIPVHKHGRRGRAERSLRLDPGEELQILPAKKWRLLKKTRRLRIAEDLSAWRGSRTHGAKPPEGPRPRTQLQRDASLRASQYPPNFVILATDKGKLVTLELATEHQAEALVHAIKPARRA
ncbi:hypothetical protein JL722_13399 [Aureococcus anophagefferens]|nr:hypothetical protein JL722_13399 [Aureococcus anophagefferens]